MKKITFILLFFSVQLIITPLLAQPIPSYILIEQAKEYDGREIEFRGEVIGEVMKRGDFAWVNVSDNFKALGVWITAEEANQINFSGDYHYRGDIILIQGVFHRSCPAHTGELDIHATRITKIRDGYEITHYFPKEKSSTVITLLLVLLLVSIMALINQKKRRNYGSRPHF